MKAIFQFFSDAFSQLRSMAMVFMNAFKKREVISYPEQMPYIPPRYRGRIVLTRDPDGEERCVACNLCAVACPVGCISLQKAETEDGRWNAEFFRINFSRCIFCGMCEESCPVDSIVETRVFDYHGEQRGDLLYTKEMLLAVGDKHEKQIAADRAADKAFR